MTYTENTYTGKGYHARCLDFYGRFEETFRGYVPPVKKNGIILDFGCANGNTTIEIANKYPDCKVIGIDLFIERIKSCNDNIMVAKKGHINAYDPFSENNIVNHAQLNVIPPNFLVSDGFKAPFKDETFDAVFCMNNIYFTSLLVDDRTFAQRLFQITRLLKQGSFSKPGGLLVISGGKSYLVMQRFRDFCYAKKIVSEKDDDYYDEFIFERLINMVEKPFHIKFS